MSTGRLSWPTRIERSRELATLAIVLAGAVSIPLFFIRDPADMFRLPKSMLLRGEAILLLGANLGAWAIGAPRPHIDWRERWVWLPLALLLTFGVLTWTSTNRILSADAFMTALASATVFFATVSVARRGGWSLVVAPLAAALANTMMILAEEADLWMPFGVKPGIPHHLLCTALVGNPNEVGGYLAAAALASLTMLLVCEKHWRLRWGTVTGILAIALVASQTLTAIIAFTVAALVAVGIQSRRTAIYGAFAAVLIGIATFAFLPPLRSRAVNISQWMRAGNYNALVTDRLTPFAAAWSMFKDHPIGGVGPAAFAWHYYDYKIQVEQTYPLLRRAYNRGINFGEVHNDHLQLLAEGGMVGYAGFVGLMVALGSISFLSVTADIRQRYAGGLALPLVIFIAVLSFAQFPLETTVVRSLLVHLAALCVGWRKP